MERRSLLLGLTVAILLLVACGGTPSSSSTTPSTGSESTSPPASGGQAVTIQFLTLDDQDMINATNAVIEAWKKSDPAYANVTVNIEAVPFAELFPKIETAVASGAVLDLFLADGPDIKHYAYNKVIIPLDKYYTKEELDGFLPINVDAGSYKGQFYSPGIMESCSLMFYNKDMTDAAGLQPPSTVKGWTMEEALEAWRKTVQKDANGNVSVWGLRWGQGTYFGDYEFSIIRRSAGTKDSPTFMGVAPDGITFKGYLDTPEAMKSYEMLRSWYQGDQPISPREAINNIFFNKQSAFYVSPDNAIGTIQRLYPDGSFNYGVTGIPYFADGAQLCHTDSWHFGISPQSKHQDVSAALVKYMTGPEGAKIWYNIVRQLPARVELLNTLPEYTQPPQQLFAQAVQEIGTTRIPTPGYTEYQQVYGEFLQNIVQSDAPLDTLVNDTVSRIEAAVAKYRGWDQ